MITTGPFSTRVRQGKLLLGVVHLKPLPGSPRYTGESLESIGAAARADAKEILDAGFDGWLLENFGDVPFFKGAVPPHVIAIMTRFALELPRGAETLTGVNVLRNDAAGALAVAAAANLQLIRVNVHIGAAVTDQGVIEGDAANTARLRRALAPDVAILADVDVKHGVQLGAPFDLAESARDAAHRGLADGLIVTGKATGSAVARNDLDRVRAAVPDRPLLAGSGVTIDSVREILATAEGVIVGSWIKRGGRVEDRVDPARARDFVLEARREWQS